jgi:hypothetical protein
LIFSSEVHELQVSASITLRDVDLPFRTTGPLTEVGPGRNILVRAPRRRADAEESAMLCPGTAEEPNPPPACCASTSTVRPTSLTAASARSRICSRPTRRATDDSTGATMRFTATGAGAVALRYVWAYKAP